MIQKTMAAKKKKGARIQPSTGIQSRQPLVAKDAKPIRPGPIRRVFEDPHFGHGTQWADLSRVGAAARSSGRQQPQWTRLSRTHDISSMVSGSPFAINKRSRTMDRRVTDDYVNRPTPWR